MNNSERGLSLSIMQRSRGINGHPVVSLNYVNADHRLPLPHPDGDWYLRNTAVPAVRDGETIICNTLIPGLEKYYRTLGLINGNAHILQVEPKLSGLSNHEIKFGYPSTDPLAILEGQVVLEHTTSPYLFSTFNSEATRRQHEALGLNSSENPDSTVTNNKTLLRLASKNYGFSMLQGQVIRDERDIQTFIQGTSHNQYGIWLKFPTGSGGDLVRHIKEITNEKMQEGVQSIRKAVHKSFDKGEFCIDGRDFWPEERIAPQQFPLVAELDARNMGNVIVNGSTQFITSKVNGGQVDIVGNFKQITSEEGEYLGNRPYSPDQELERKIINEVNKVADYNMNENGYFGVQGVDWFAVRDSSGKDKVYVVELNSRPTANTPPLIVAQKLGVDEWINTNAYTNTPIENIEDYVNIVGKDLAYGDPFKDGLVIPQAFRTLVSRRRTIPSPNFKMLILGSSADGCDNIQMILKRRGISFTSS